jgi:subtilase family serine protease
MHTYIPSIARFFSPICSPMYGKWMTQDEVNALTAPKAEDRAAVREWITSTGATCTDAQSSLECTGTVGQMEALLKTEFTEFKHTAKNNKKLIRIHPDTTWEAPTHLENKLMFVTNLADFPTVRMRLGSKHLATPVGGALPVANTRGGARKAQAANDLAINMETLSAFYKLPAEPLGGSAATTAPAEFQNDTAIATSDVKDFATGSNVPYWTLNTTVGPFDPSNPDIEASLDTQYIGGVGNGNTQWYWTETDWMYDFTQTISGTAAVPQVFSISWGWSEADQCMIDPVGPCAAKPASSSGYVAECNAGFAAATARGITILVSSGDSGAHGRTDGGCAAPLTLPDWPAASPYILSVGATQVMINTTTPIANPTSPYCKAPPAGLPACAGGGTEIVASPATGALVSSGGGFSNVAPASSWQTGPIATYLASGALLPGAGNFNTTGRAYPDVAALGHNVVMYVSGPLLVDGTSCSSPIFAGVIGNINAARLAAGKAVLGYANQALYQIAQSTPSAFNDVTLGDNSCTEDGCATTCTGFGATKGYDAATGWGTPNYPALLAAALALP